VKQAFDLYFSSDGSATRDLSIHFKVNGVRHFITDMPSKQVGACAQRAMWRFSLGNCFLRTAKLVW
jgi:hypothetical protein